MVFCNNHFFCLSLLPSFHGHSSYLAGKGGDNSFSFPPLFLVSFGNLVAPAAFCNRFQRHSATTVYLTVAFRFPGRQASFTRKRVDLE